MQNETQPEMDNWDDFLGKFLKVDMVKQWPALFIPISVKGNIDDEDNATIVYTGEFSGKKKLFQPNKTNIDIMRNALIKSPKDLIGKKVYFKQVMNFNPQLKKKVPSLEIDRIE